MSYWHANWSDEDLAMVRAKRGETSGQAVLEAYALLISVATWAKILVNAQGALHIRVDALGVLQGMLRFRAKDPVLNAIAGEMAYLIAPIGLDLRAAHIWSERNDVCDYLSRLSPGELSERAELKGAVKARRQPAPKFLLENLVGIVKEPRKTKTETARHVVLTFGGQSGCTSRGEGHTVENTEPAAEI